MNKKFRAFFAWMLPEPLQLEIKPYLNSLKKEFLSTDIRFTALEQLHLTLRFLGNISEEDSLRLVTAAEHTLKNTPSFSIQLTGIDFFPSQQSKKTLIATCPPNPALITLTHAIEQLVQSLGVTPETRPFHPHVTLARMREKLRKEIINTDFSLPIDGIVQEISLMRSDSTKDGVVYSSVWTKTLKD
ncbi:MAG: RNA 2',3'-cyclic phosphodiesterase [Pseudomonadota bacterium]